MKVTIEHDGSIAIFEVTEGKDGGYVVANKIEGNTCTWTALGLLSAKHRALTALANIVSNRIVTSY